MKHKKHLERNEAKQGAHEKRGPTAFVKKYPGFTVATIIAVLVIVAFFASSLMTGYSPTAEQTAVLRSLYEENQLQLDDLIVGASEQLNGNYGSVIEDDYFSSARDDFVWLKAKETELYYTLPAQDAYAREGAFTFFMQKILQINEDAAYLLDTQNFDSTITAAQKVSVPTVTDFNSVEDFFQSGMTKEDYDIMMNNSSYVENRFLATTNALIVEYYSAKSQILEGDSSQERKYVEAKKLLLLS